MSAEEILEQRKNKFLKIGRNKGFMNNSDDLSSLKVQVRSIDQILNYKKEIIISIGLIAISIILFSLFL